MAAPKPTTITVVKVRDPGATAFDAWSVAHILAGTWLGVTGTSRRAVVAMLIGWEFFEVGMRRTTPGGAGMFEHESPRNIMTDIALGMVGWWVGKKWLVVPAALAWKRAQRAMA